MNQEGKYWHSVNGNVCEIEASIFIAALVRLIQPEFVVESGSFEGQTTKYIGMALRENGHGTLESLEIDEGLSKVAANRCVEYPVRVININSFDYIPDKLIDLLYIDGDYNRDGDVRHFLPYMAGGSIIVVHDMIAPINIPQRENIIKMCGDEHILFNIPRGLLVVKLPMIKAVSPSSIIRDRLGYLQIDELSALKQCIDRLPNGSVCVNIGAGYGTSGLAFIENSNVGKLYTIDKYKFYAENNLGTLGHELGVFCEFGFGQDPRYLQIQGDSAEVGRNWSEPIDMLFLDGDHSYEHCVLDIKAWLPHVKQGGIFAFHDYKEPQWPGIQKAVEELMYEHQMISNAGTFAAFRISPLMI